MYGMMAFEEGVEVARTGAFSTKLDVGLYARTPVIIKFRNVIKIEFVLLRWPPVHINFFALVDVRKTSLFSFPFRVGAGRSQYGAKKQERRQGYLNIRHYTFLFVCPL